MKDRNLLKGLLFVNIPLIVILVLINLPFVTARLGISPLLVLLVSFIFLIFINIFYASMLSRVKLSVGIMEKQLNDLNTGNYKKQEKVKSNLFFNAAEIQKQLDVLLQTRKNTITKIQDIAEGKLDEELENQNDDISKKLTILQQNLAKDKAELEKTKVEEEKRNWIATGLAMFSDILRQDTTNIREMGYSIISNLVDYIKFNQGALYVIVEEEGSSEVYFESVATVAYDRRKMIQKKIHIGEGLVGRCAFEKKSIFLTEVPQDYIHIKSGLGSANPENLLLVPCMLEDKVYGIIEVASFNNIEKHEHEFIEKLGESIASSISNVRNNERTNALLRASQSQGEELAAQEEELRQNLEEMEATQEDLKRQMELNKEMQQELKYEKYLFDVLLNNIPARINFKNNKHEFMRASKSFLDFFGKESNDEIKGKTDIDFFGEEFAAKTMADEREIMNTKQGRINYVEYQKKDDGTEMWKNVSKIPLLDDAGNCIGLFASVYDISELKRGEKLLAEEKRLFDTLLNNIPARINFKDADRKYIRASQSFLKRFGVESNEEIVGKTDFDFFDVDFAEHTKADELEIMNSKQGRINFVEHEQKDNGDEIWKNVSKVPMLDEEGNCIGIFASVYDITNFKKVELENQKLKEEIKKLKKKR